MPRGAPDYSNVRAPESLTRLDDMAELAARTGTLSTYERSGSVVRQIDFSDGMSLWYTALYGSGAQVEVSAQRSVSAGYSLKFVTGQDGARGAIAIYKLPYLKLSRMGLEYSFTHTVDSEFHHFVFYHLNGTIKRIYWIRFNIQSGLIQLRQYGDTWVNIVTGLNLKTDEWTLYTTKLVVDLENDCYVRFFLNDKMYNISEYKPAELTVSSIPYLEIAIQFNGDPASNRTHYVDNVIITQNEP